MADTLPVGVLPVPDLDHIGLIVRDLEASCELLARLGFNQTRRADHTRSNERGETVAAGSSQRSIMLQQGYVEIMQITDMQAGHPLTSAARTRFGLHILALGMADAGSMHARLTSQGTTISPLRDWSRPVQEDGVAGTALFRFFDAPWTQGDASYLCWVQHRTPELMRPSHLLRHPNGALALRGLHYRGPADMVGPWVDRLLAAGAALAGRDERAVTLTLGSSAIMVQREDSAAALLPWAIALDFADLDLLRRDCVAAGHPPQRQTATSFELDLRDELGLVWICQQA